ncbi:MAG: hypothetical protein FJX71_06080 [Alphaproteobacteria bacterium]|nr:hypothetical protein [Alphaproteobacteria bacterium]
MKFFRFTTPFLLASAFSISHYAEAENSPSTPTTAQQLSDLKRQTAENNKKIQELELRINNHGFVYEPQQVHHNWPKRYIEIPNTNSAIQIFANPNLAVAYDASSYSAEIVYPPLLPLQGVNADLKKGRYIAEARGTQFGFRTLSYTKIGELKSEVSLDFWGSTFNILPSTPFYQPRVRYAYIDVAGWTAGHTTSNFLDPDAIGQTVDYGSVYGVAYRHGLIKYTFNFNQQTNLAIAIERPSTDYTNQLGQSINYDNPIPASANNLPDVTAHLKIKDDKRGHASFRAVLRQLKVKDYTLAVPFMAKKTGWGLGISTELLVYGKSNVFGQYNFGNGIGRYIDILNGQSSLYNANLRVLDTQWATNLILGFEHFWSECLRTNLIYANSHVQVSKFTPVLTGPTRVTQAINQFFLNLIYSPIEPLDIGLEYEFANRISSDNYRGVANRITLGIVYRF